MRKYVMILGFVLFAMSLSAQTRKAIYGELLGGSNGIGISFDSRFKPAGKWGYRVGVGYAFGRSRNSFFDISTSFDGICIPLELNYLTGTRNHHFEVGGGVNVGEYWSKYRMGNESVSSSTWGYYYYGNIGYRYQRPKGFFFRGGISLGADFGDKHGLIGGVTLTPYLGFGLSF